MNENEQRQEDERREADEAQTSADMNDAEGALDETADAYDEGHVVNDNSDEPQNPDEQTVAETTAAQSAIWNPSSAKKKRGPNGIVILALVLIAIIGLGVYAVWWSNHLFEKNEIIELRKLEGRVFMADVQKKYMAIRYPQGGISPPGVVYKPLGPEENARYELLMAKYKDRRQKFEPDPNEKLLIDDLAKLTSSR